MRIWLVFTLLAVGAVAGAAPTVEAPKLTGTVKVDGQLTESAWQGAPPLKDFVVLGGTTPAQVQTQAWVAVDAEALYVALKALDPEMDKLRAETEEHDSAKLFEDDVLEIYLDPARDKFHYLQFAFNAKGTQFDLQGDAAGSSPEWSGRWTVATARQADGWTAEVRLPLGNLGLGRVPGGPWGFNLCRERPGNGELSSWAPSGGKFATPANFGELTVPMDLTPFRLELAVTDWGKGLWGHNRLAGKVSNLGKSGRELTLRLEVNSPHEKPRVTTRDRLTVAAGGSREFELDYQLFQDGVHTLTLVAADQRTGRLHCATGRTLQVSAIADFTVHKSFYRDDVALHYQVNAAGKDLARFQVKAVLRAAGKDEPLATREVARLTAAEGILRFETSQLPRGQYALEALLLNGGGQVQLRKALGFAELRDRQVTKRLVTVRPEDNMLLVEGKPFFPIGIYESPVTLTYLQRLKEAGFNLCLSHSVPGEAFKPFLDAIHGAGMKLWVPVSSQMDFSQDETVKRQKLADLVRRVGDHPALLCWESIDEPAWGSQSAEGLYAGYCYLRELDQQRIIWTNHAPRNLISTLAYYNRATDIGGCDIYPVPEGTGHSNLPNPAISVVGDETDKNSVALGGERPVFMVLQGFGWLELSKRDGQPVKPIMPTFTQSRFMAYQSIVHGANGVLYWGTHYTAKPSAFWSELRTVVSELSALQEVLAAPSYQADDRAKLTAPATGVRYLHKKLSSGNYLLVVNETAQAVTASFNVPNIYAGRVRRLFEDTHLELKADQVLRVPLEPYGVAVLSDDSSFVDVRREFPLEPGAEGRESDAAAVTVPGNAVRNPGFEVDRDGDEIPDRWGGNIPLSVTLAKNDKHGGEQSVALTSDSPTVGPLMVQRNLDVVGGHKYRFTAWVKSPSPEAEFRYYVEWVLGDKWLGKVLPWTKGNGEWQQFTIEFEAKPDPQGGAYAVIQMRGKGTVYFDDLHLEEIP